MPRPTESAHSSPPLHPMLHFSIPSSLSLSPPSICPSVQSVFLTVSSHLPLQFCNQKKKKSNQRNEVFDPRVSNNILTGITAHLPCPIPLTALGSVGKSSKFCSQELEVSCVIKNPPSPQTVSHMRPKDGSVAERHINTFSDVYPERGGWGKKQGKPGCIDDPGGGAVQKREAFRQIWPGAKM